MNDLTKMVQGSLFEKDYLRRTLGTLAHSADVALSELVANAWDAGASEVRITIPERSELTLTVQDDGCGLTHGEFINRWMKLGYNRLDHQGEMAEFPPTRHGKQRVAFGRNGIGRHGMLCFGDEYEVITGKAGTENRFAIGTSSGPHPFVILNHSTSSTDWVGTKLKVKVIRNIPSADEMSQLLSARFMFDPEFKVYVNNTSLSLVQLSGFVDQRTLNVAGHKLEASVIDTHKAGKTSKQSGVAFWVGGKLVGQPGWSFPKKHLLDARTSFGKRYTIIVQTEDLRNEVTADWLGFKPTPLMEEVFLEVAEYVNEILLTVSKETISTTVEEVFRKNRTELEDLERHAKREVSEVVKRITNEHPTISSETLSIAVQAVINLEQTRSGASLLKKLSELTANDIDALNQLLDEWSLSDALAVLDEIDRRLKVIDAIEKLSKDESTDELHTLHPLVTEARWVFGPEFDTPEYSSNLSLRNAAEKVFNISLANDAFINSRKRPDLLTLADSTLSLVGTETFDDEQDLPRMRSVLIIELKKGRSTIGRKEMEQATGYIEDFSHCGHIDGAPKYKAFVVGHTVDDKTSTERSVENHRIYATTYARLVRSAQKRLFGLKEKLQERYDQFPEDDLLNRVLREPLQLQSPNT